VFAALCVDCDHVEFSVNASCDCGCHVRLDKIEGYLEIGTTGLGAVVMNLDKDRNGVGHIIFSPRQAKNLGNLLIRKAKTAENEVPSGSSGNAQPITARSQPRT